MSTTSARMVQPLPADCPSSQIRRMNIGKVQNGQEGKEGTRFSCARMYGDLNDSQGGRLHSDIM